jgi:hypothetical protein
VAEGAGELCFAEEAVGDAGEEDDLGAEHLDGDPSAERLLFGLEDDAKAPASQLAQELVASGEARVGVGEGDDVEGLGGRGHTAGHWWWGA